MKIKTISILVGILFLALAGNANAISIRAGIGQFVPEDSTIKDSYANAYMADVRFYLSEPLFISGGALLYNVHSTELELSTPSPNGGEVTVGSFKHRVDAFGAYGGIGIGKLIGGGAKSGLYPYACVAVGFISPVVSQRIEYTTEGEPTIAAADLQANRQWALMVTPHAGLEVRFLGFGAFAQVNYLWGNPVTYDPVEVEGVEIFEGGELTPSGWVIFVGW